MSLALSLRSALEATAKSTALEFCTEMDEADSRNLQEGPVDNGRSRKEEARGGSSLPAKVLLELN